MKNISRVLSLALAVILLAASLVGCSFEEKVKDKVFSDKGVSITLTEDFFEQEYIGYTSVYQSQAVLVFVLKEEFTLFPTSFLSSTVKEYAELACDLNEIPDAVVTEKDTYAEFEYDHSANANDYYYYARAYKTDDAFWLIQFACMKDAKDEYTADFAKWADSIVFDAPAEA